MASFEERCRAIAGWLLSRTETIDADGVRDLLRAADAAEPEIGAVRRWLAGEAVDVEALPERLREVLSERDECSPRIAARADQPPLGPHERVAELVTAFDAERSERRAVERQRDEARAEVERLKRELDEERAWMREEKRHNIRMRAALDEIAVCLGRDGDDLKVLVEDVQRCSDGVIETDKKIARLEGELADVRAKCSEAQALVSHYREREAHFASVLRVPDSGQYRADWDGAIRQVLNERDALAATVREQAAALTRVRAALDEAFPIVHEEDTELGDEMEFASNEITAVLDDAAELDDRDAADFARALADAAAKGEPSERVPTPEEASVLRALVSAAGQMTNAGMVGWEVSAEEWEEMKPRLIADEWITEHLGRFIGRIQITPAGRAALARFEAQEAAREKAAPGPHPCEYCNHESGCGPRAEAIGARCTWPGEDHARGCAICDPCGNHEGHVSPACRAAEDLISWRARALAAEAEVKAEKAAHDGTREALRVCVDGENALTAEVARLRSELADVLAERDAMQALATQRGRELAKAQAHKPGCARCSGRTDDAPCCRHHGDYLHDDGGRMVCAFCFRPCNDRHGGA